MRSFVLVLVFILSIGPLSNADVVKLESPLLRVEVDDTTGRWALLDKRSGTQWPSNGNSTPIAMCKRSLTWKGRIMVDEIPPKVPCYRNVTDDGDKSG
jgi:hypothetical protein